METEKKEVQNESKKKILSLKPMKKNENGVKRKFKQLTDVLISFHLLPFFTVKEAKEIGKINIKFYNSFVRYYERISDDLINKYNLKMENDYDSNTLYEQKDDKGHFIKVNFFNLTHYLIFSYFNWAWQDNKIYWTKITPKNSILNKDIFKLNTVCYIDVNAKMTHLYQGKYKLYLNHCVCRLAENKIKMIISLDGVQLQEFIYPSKEQKDRCRSFHEEEEKKNEKKEGDKKEEEKKEENKKEEEKKEEENKEENKVLVEKKVDFIGLFGRRLRPFGLRQRIGLRNNEDEPNKDNSLYKEYITDIIVNYDKNIDNGNGHEFSILFQHVEGSWKNNWLIDAVIFEKIDE